MAENRSTPLKSLINQLINQQNPDDIARAPPSEKSEEEHEIEASATQHIGKPVVPKPRATESFSQRGKKIEHVREGSATKHIKKPVVSDKSSEVYRWLRERESSTKQVSTIKRKSQASSSMSRRASSSDDSSDDNVPYSAHYSNVGVPSMQYQQRSRRVSSSPYSAHYSDSCPGYFSRTTNSDVTHALQNLSTKMDSIKCIIEEKFEEKFAALNEDLSKKIENQTSLILIESKNKPIGTDKEKIETVKGLEHVLRQEDSRFNVNLDAGADAASQNIRTNSIDQTSNDTTKTWNQDAKAWRMCIGLNDKKEAQRLLGERILPDHETLTIASLVFESDPHLLKMIYDEISSCINSESYNIINVYAGYEHKDHKPVEEKAVVFAVITTSNITVVNKFGFKIEQICVNDVNSSLENNDIRIKERENPANEDAIIKAETAITHHSQALMEKHKNITRISVSWIKSTNYGRQDASMKMEVCISLYVPKKGLIPVEEKLFPKTLNEFPVDVREGVCTPFLGSYDVHQNIKIGCAISGHKIADQSMIGTLGGFFEKENQVYGLTCAHVFAQNPNLKDLKATRTWEASADDQCNYVYQPTQDTGPFGSLVRAVLTEGGNDTSGVDASIFHVRKRHPNSGQFPDADNDRDAGFDEKQPMMFNSGTLSSEVKRLALAVKYGSSTGITKGSFRIRGCAVRMTTAALRDWGFVLYKQYEIESFGDTKFASVGDSGAMVFTVEENELIGIGIVEAGMGNVCFVTPIYDVFMALCIPPPYEMKRFNLGENTSIFCSGGSAVSNKDEKKRLEKAIDYKLNNLDQALSQDIAKQTKDESSKIERQFSEFKTELCAEFDQKIYHLKEEMKAEQKENRDQMQKMMEDTLEKIGKLFQNQSKIDGK